MLSRHRHQWRRRLTRLPARIAAHKKTITQRDLSLQVVLVVALFVIAAVALALAAGMLTDLLL